MIWYQKYKNRQVVENYGRKNDYELEIMLTSRPFPSSPGPMFQNEGRCSAFDMEIIFHSHANKTHSHKKGCVPSVKSPNPVEGD